MTVIIPSPDVQSHTCAMGLRIVIIWIMRMLENSSSDSPAKSFCKILQQLSAGVLVGKNGGFCTAELFAAVGSVPVLSHFLALDFVNSVTDQWAAS